MYDLAKLQPDMVITFRTMALQSSNSKMIDLGKIGTYENALMNGMSHRSYNLHHCVRHE